MPSSTYRFSFKTSVTMDQLPDSVLVKIFEYLSVLQRIRIEEVGKRWNGLSKCAWSHVQVLSWSSFIPELEFTPFFGEVNSGMLNVVLRRCGKYLKTFDFSENGICRFSYRNYEPRARVLSMLYEFCRNLQTVCLSEFRLECRSPYSYLLPPCTELTSITFSNCIEVPSPDRELRALFREYRNLTSLNLSRNETINGECFADLPDKLEYLYLSGCVGLKDKGVQAIGDRCPNLKVLDLSCCVNIRSKFLQYAVQKLADLRVLNLDYCHARPLSMTFLPLDQLQKLCMRYNNRVGDKELSVISRACDNLNTLDVRDCYKITDNGLVHLRRLRQLTELHLDGCKDITDDGVKMLAMMGNLEELSLKFCKNISDESVAELATSCLKLRQLNLSFCIKITQATVMKFHQIADTKTALLTLRLAETGVSAENENQVEHPKLKILFRSW